MFVIREIQESLFLSLKGKILRELNIIESRHYFLSYFMSVALLTHYYSAKHNHLICFLLRLLEEDSFAC